MYVSSLSSCIFMCDVRPPYWEAETAAAPATSCARVRTVHQAAEHVFYISKNMMTKKIWTKSFPSFFSLFSISSARIGFIEKTNNKKAAPSAVQFKTSQKKEMCDAEWGRFWQGNATLIVSLPLWYDPVREKNHTKKSWCWVVLILRIISLIYIFLFICCR